MICMQTQFVFICDNLCIRRCYPYPPPPVHLIIFSTEFNTQTSGVCRCTVVVVGGGGGAWGGGGSALQIRMGGNLQKFIIIYRGVASKNISKGECGCRVTSTKFQKHPPPLSTYYNHVIFSDRNQ